jgi:WD40 repeat protein
VSRDEAEDELGGQLSVYQVDARRIMTASAWGIVIGAASGLIAIGVAIRIADNNITISGPNYIVGLPLVLSLLLPLGLVRGFQALLHRGESYAVHENGLVHHSRSIDVAVPWADVLDVRARGREVHNGWRMWFGLGFSGRIRCAGGLTFHVDGMTSGVEPFCTEITRHLAAYRGDAAPDPRPARETRRQSLLRATGITALAIVVIGGLSAGVIAIAHEAASARGSGAGPAIDGYPSATTQGLTLTLADPANSAVTDSVFSPDGKTIATCDKAGRVYLWSVASGKPQAVFATGPHSALNSVAFSPDGTTLAAAGGKPGTYVWDVATARPVAVLPDPKGSGAASATFSPNGQILAVADGNNYVYLWNTATWTPAATLADPNGGSPAFATFSPDGTTLAVIGELGLIDLWNVPTRHLRSRFPQFPEATAGEVSFSPDGKSLAVPYGNGTAIEWDLLTGRAGNTTAAQDPSLAAANGTAVFSPDGKTLATAFPDGGTFLFDASSGNLKSTLIDPGAEQDFGSNATGDIGTVSTAFSPDGTLLAASGGTLNATFVWRLP